MAAGFDVRYGVVQRLSEQFDRRADLLHDQVEAFGSHAQGRAEVLVAFGLLGQCTDAADTYRAMAERTREALAHVEEVVRADAERLRQSVQAYEGADASVCRVFDELASPHDTSEEGPRR